MGASQRAAVLLAALGVLACGAQEQLAQPAESARPPEAVHEAPGSAPTEAGLYRVAIAPEAGAVPLGPMHDWVIEVETAEGERFAPTRLAFDGGMSQHGHGFVTGPRVTRALAPGRYLVEGVKFHMGGDWTLRVELVGPAGPDVAVFRVRVGG